MTSHFCIIPFGVNLSTKISVYNSFTTTHYYLTACCWLCTTMIAVVFWNACMPNRCTCCHHHYCEVFKMHDERYAAQLKYEIMDGKRGDHVKQNWVFVTHFIHLLNITMPMPCTDIHSKVPMSHFWNRQVGMDWQALNVQSRADFVLKMSFMHACLLNVQPI